MTLSVTVDNSQVLDLSRRLRGMTHDMNQSLSHALNNTADGVKVQLSKEFRQHIAIDKYGTGKYIQINRASPTNLLTNVFIKAGSARIPGQRQPGRPSLKYFGAKQTIRGVSVKIYPKKPRRLIKSAFGPLIPRLGYNVFRRKDNDRKPIWKLYGPSLAGVYKYNKMGQSIVAFAKERLAKELQRQIRGSFKRWKKLGGTISSRIA